MEYENIFIDSVQSDRVFMNSWFIIENNQCIIIDCNKYTLQYITKHSLNPVYLFVTHEHFDHIEGIASIKHVFPKMKIISSETTSAAMINPRENLSLFYDGIGFIETSADIHIENQNVFLFYNKHMRAYLTPGHSLGSSIYVYDDKYVFCGDTLLNGFRTPAIFPNSSYSDLEKSVKLIDDITYDDAIFFTGHGLPFKKNYWDKKLTLSKKNNRKIYDVCNINNIMI